jgi:hypothetical protein
MACMSSRGRQREKKGSGLERIVVLPLESSSAQEKEKAIYLCLWLLPSKILSDKRPPIKSNAHRRSIERPPPIRMPFIDRAHHPTHPYTPFLYTRCKKRHWRPLTARSSGRNFVARTVFLTRDVEAVPQGWKMRRQEPQSTRAT